MEFVGRPYNNATLSRAHAVVSSPYTESSAYGDHNKFSKTIKFNDDDDDDDLLEIKTGISCTVSTVSMLITVSVNFIDDSL